MQRLGKDFQILLHLRRRSQAIRDLYCISSSFTVLPLRIPYLNGTSRMSSLHLESRPSNQEIR